MADSDKTYIFAFESKNNVVMEEKKKIILHVCDEEIEYFLPEKDVKLLQEAAELVTKKFDEYSKLSSSKYKSAHSIGLLTMLDLATNQLIYKSQCYQRQTHIGQNLAYNQFEDDESN